MIGLIPLYASKSKFINSDYGSWKYSADFYMAIEFSSTDIYAVGVTGNANAHKLCLPKLSTFSCYGKNEKYALHVSTPDDHASYFELVLVILVNDYFHRISFNNF